MATQRGYTGISFPFRFSGRGGVATSTTSPTNFSHIKESIQQILLTNVGERIMEPDFGINAREVLFSATEDETEQSVLKFLIKEAIEKFEKRVEIQDIRIITDESSVMEGTIVVEIDFLVKKYLTSDSVKVTLN